MSKQIYFLQLLLFIFAAPIFAKNEGMVTGNVSLNLQKETISAKLRYDYIAKTENESSVKFLINKDFSIIKLKCKVCSSFDSDGKERSLKVLQFQFKRPLKLNEKVQIEFEYSGKLGEIYNQKEQFLEMGLDFFWIPYDSQIGEFNYKYRLNIKSDAPDFVMTGNGKTTRNGKDWLIESKTSDFDINIIFAKDLAIKNFQENGYNLQVVSKNMTEEVSSGLLKGMVETLDFYNSTFGKNNPQREVTAVFRPFPLELGYFRKGFFILPSPKTADSLFFPISHELAHYWWLKADQQNAWLNESFAEYSAMMGVRKLRGIEKFNEILERKRKQNVNLPPIYGFDRTKNRQQTPMVLYVKGSLKLYDLEQDLGEEKFLQFLQKVENEQIIETDKLIEALRKFASDEIADKFLANLKQ